MREHNIQNMIRLKLADEDGLYFRGNVGRGWTGDKIIVTGSIVTIYNARPFSSGLPTGFSDLFGITPILIEKKHVGKTVGVATFIEVKNKTRLRKKQKDFLELCKKAGSIAGVAYNVEDALNLINDSTFL